jgi:transposase-like protein
MKANLRSIHKHCRYSEEFKKQIVQDFESAKFSVPQLEKLHGVSNPTIYNWIYKFSTSNAQGFRIVEMNDSSTQKMKELQARIRELEGAAGRKHIKIDYLEKMMDIARDELDIDIKKTVPPNNQLGQGKKGRNDSFSK